jgi:hypothetical protein
MVVLLKFQTCPYLTYLATLPTGGQSICAFTWTVDDLMVAINNDFSAFVPFNPVVPTTTQKRRLSVFCVFASEEDEYRQKYCDVVQGRYIAGKPTTSSICRFSHWRMLRDLVGGLTYVLVWSCVGFCW